MLSLRWATEAFQQSALPTPAPSDAPVGFFSSRHAILRQDPSFQQALSTSGLDFLLKIQCTLWGRTKHFPPSFLRFSGGSNNQIDMRQVNGENNQV